MAPISKYVTVNRVRLRYLDWGERGRPPLVCLHDHTGQAHVWDDFAMTMRSAYHVYAPDQRGHGDSDHAEDGYDQDRFVEDLAAFVDALGLDQFTLVGQALGGWTSMLYAADRPNRVNRLVLVDIGPEPSEESIQQHRFRPQAPLTFDTIESAVEWLRSDSPRASADSLMRDALAKMKRTGDGSWTWKANYGLFEITRIDMSDPSIIGRCWSALESIQCPILEVRGAESSLVTDTVLERMKAAATDLTSVDVSRAGHMVTIEQPESFINATRGFLTPDD